MISRCDKHEKGKNNELLIIYRLIEIYSAREGKEQRKNNVTSSETFGENGRVSVFLLT